MSCKTYIANIGLFINLFNHPSHIQFSKKYSHVVQGLVINDEQTVQWADMYQPVALPTISVKHPTINSWLNL